MTKRAPVIEDSAAKPMSALNWDKLRVFHAVAEAGSFTHAGEVLHLSQSAVSRQIGGLEASLKAPLFHRHARGLIPTEQGEVLYRAVREIFGRLSEAEALIAESKAKPEGPLRVSTTVGFGSIWLTPRIHEFLETYPEIALTLYVNDDDVDLNVREADIAIRMSPPRQPDLVQRRLMTVHFHVYAAPNYLKRFGIPKSAEDLDNHRIIVYAKDRRESFPGTDWLLTAGTDPSTPRNPVYRVNNVYALSRAVQSGLGVASLPDYLIGRDSPLVRVLPELHGPGLDAFFVYPEALRRSARVTVFRDFLIRKIAETEF